MRKFILLTVCGLATFIYCQTQTTTVKIAKVLDGDTYETETGTRIRLYSGDCPELGQEFGPEAKRYVSGLILDKSVKVEWKGTDKYGRKLAELYYPSGSTYDTLGVHLLRNGYAWALTWHTQYRLIEAEARQTKRGLWAKGSPTPPFIWRRQNKK